MDYENILTALKNGNVPSDGALEICMGRDDEIKEFEQILDKVKNGKAYTKFIKGSYGAGKSFFLKVIEEMAYKENFVVSWITLSNEIPFNKFDVVYKNIAKNLTCKTGTSLEHIIERWITGIKMMAFEETMDPQRQNEIIERNIREDLREVSEHSNPMAVAIENYHKFTNMGDYETAKYIQSWLRGDSQIPFTIKRKFGVKGDVDKETALKYLEALSILIKSIGYDGLVVLIDEAEFIMKLHTSKLRDIAYNYIRDLYDDCSAGKFKNSLFLFASALEFFDDPKKGVVSYPPLNDRIEDTLKSDLKDMRKPILELKGFNRDNLVEIAKKSMIIHEDAYKWNGGEKINPIIDTIIDKHQENAELTGGKITPRIFIRSFISILDTVQQNQDFFSDSNSILTLFEDKEAEIEKELEKDW
ncbi:MAG: ATP-binding protein [Methanobrevibacter sp.]|nr:ATP-binding protein [Candidatus Methanovirga aequatorialis]